VKRSVATYFFLFVTAIALFVVHATLPEGRSGRDWQWALFRDGLLVLAVACAVATWGAAVRIASVFRVVWPVALATLGVCGPLLFLLVEHGAAC
jgi:hypothetical protein